MKEEYKPKTFMEDEKKDACDNEFGNITDIFFIIKKFADLYYIFPSFLLKR